MSDNEKPKSQKPKAREIVFNGSVGRVYNGGKFGDLTINITMGKKGTSVEVTETEENS